MFDRIAVDYSAKAGNTIVFSPDCNNEALLLIQWETDLDNSPAHTGSVFTLHGNEHGADYKAF